LQYNTKYNITTWFQYDYLLFLFRPLLVAWCDPFSLHIQFNNSRYAKRVVQSEGM
jgi:hypothetical protein